MKYLRQMVSEYMVYILTTKARASCARIGSESNQYYSFLRI